MNAPLVTTLAAPAVLAVATLAVLALHRRPRTALFTSTGIALAGCVLGAAAATWALIDGTTGTVATVWQAPLGALTFGIDPLSSFFLLCVYVVGGLGALFGAGYVDRLRDHLRPTHVAAWYPLLIASMAAVALARDAVAFLMAWEAMTLASFFLVTADGEPAARPGIVYLLASQLGLAPLIAMFMLLAAHAGGSGFDAMHAAGSPGAWTAAAAFLLALVGFGAKAGFWPLHVWLPEAHPAAPSHVSAVMSGVMIKMGIYGLLRTLSFMGMPPAWWGMVLLTVGAVSGVGGILHALAQRDLKRLLAYSSVENLGIITLGLGLGVLGLSAGNAPVAALGLAGGLLHVLNHGLFKGLLFQGAGAILVAAGKGDFDRLGGLWRRMPVTSATFLAGSAAITGLPPFNGFASELLLFVGAFVGATTLPPALRLWALSVIPVLALIGGLAAACFVKAFGITFLGDLRAPEAANARETGRSMRLAMVLGASACLAIGLLPVPFVMLALRGVAVLGVPATLPAEVAGALSMVPWFAVALIGLALALTALRRALLRGRDVRRASTWGCGYESPSPRMQYTAPSFADPVLAPAHFLLNVHCDEEPARGPFPTRAVNRRHLGDLAAERFWTSLVRGVLALAGRFGRRPGDDVAGYLVLVLLTLVGLLLWQAWMR